MWIDKVGNINDYQKPYLNIIDSGVGGGITGLIQKVILAGLQPSEP